MASKGQLCKKFIGRGDLITLRGRQKIDSVPLNIHWTLKEGGGSRELTHGR